MSTKCALNLLKLIEIYSFFCRPETKEGKEGGEQEKSNEQEGTDGDKIEKELEKDKVRRIIQLKVLSTND